MKKQYFVNTKIVYGKVIPVYANSENEAVEEVKDRIDNGEVEIDPLKDDIVEWDTYEVWEDDCPMPYDELEDQAKIDYWCDVMIPAILYEDADFVSKATPDRISDLICDLRDSGVDVPERLETNDMWKAVIKYRLTHK